MLRITPFLFALILTAGIAKAATFIEGLEDVPIMDGMTQIKDSGINFGNAESRFVESHLSSPTLHFNEVKSFYQKTLPQLGWAQVGDDKNMVLFAREKEIMEIAREDSSPLQIRLTVKSK